MSGSFAQFLPVLCLHPYSSFSCPEMRRKKPAGSPLRPGAGKKAPLPARAGSGAPPEVNNKRNITEAEDVRPR